MNKLTFDPNTDTPDKLPARPYATPESVERAQRVYARPQVPQTTIQPARSGLRHVSWFNLFADTFGSALFFGALLFLVMLAIQPSQ